MWASPSSWIGKEATFLTLSFLQRQSRRLRTPFSMRHQQLKNLTLKRKKRRLRKVMRPDFLRLIKTIYSISSLMLINWSPSQRIPFCCFRLLLLTIVTLCIREWLPTIHLLSHPIYSSWVSNGEDSEQNKRGGKIDSNTGSLFLQDEINVVLGSQILAYYCHIQTLHAW